MFKLSVFSLLLLATQAQPVKATELIAVEKHSGFVTPENSYNQRCMVGSATTTRNLSFGRFGHTVRLDRTRYTAGVPNARVAQRLIRRATLGTLQITHGHTDGPTESHYGILGDVRVTLLNDQSINITRNNAPGVTALLYFSNLNCPTPH